MGEKDVLCVSVCLCVCYAVVKVVHMLLVW